MVSFILPTPCSLSLSLPLSPTPNISTSLAYGRSVFVPSSFAKTLVLALLES